MENNLFVNNYLFFLIPVISCVFLMVLVFYFSYLRHIRNLRVLRFRAFENLENEKLRITRELHDSLGAFLIPLKGFINSNGQFDSSNADFWNQHVSNFETYISSMNENLYPSELLDNNLGQALNGLSSSLNYSNCKLIIAHFPDLNLKGSANIHVFRIIQETLINAIKHAKPDYISVTHLLNQDSFVIAISYQPSENSGNNIQGKLGRGHANIEHRLSLLNANYRIIIDEDVVFEKFNFVLNEA